MKFTEEVYLKNYKNLKVHPAVTQKSHQKLYMVKMSFYISRTRIQSGLLRKSEENKN